MVIVVMLVLVALNANLDDLFEYCGIFPADGCQTRRGIENGNGLYGLQADANARDVTSGRYVKLDKSTYDLVVGHGRPFVCLGQRTIRRM